MNKLAVTDNKPVDGYSYIDIERRAVQQVRSWLLRIISPACLQTIYGVEAWKRRKEAEHVRDSHIKTGHQINLAKLISDTIEEGDIGDESDTVQKFMLAQEKRMMRKRNRERSKLSKINKAQRRRLNRIANTQKKQQRSAKTPHQQQQRTQQQTQPPVPYQSPAVLQLTGQYNNQNINAVTPTPTPIAGLPLPPPPPPYPNPPPPPPMKPYGQTQQTQQQLMPPPQPRPTPYHSNRVRFNTTVANNTMRYAVNPYYIPKKPKFTPTSAKHAPQVLQQHVINGQSRAQGHANAGTNGSTNRRLRF